MLYLHKKKILHRDLNLQNIVVTSKESTRLMDFGLSSLSTAPNQTKTVCVGTSIFMAPEVLRGNYSYPCDVFSFSILVFVILTENFAPYGSKRNINIEKKVAEDSNFRPNLNEINNLKDHIKGINQIKEFLKTNWNVDPKQRMEFARISSFFSTLETDSMEWNHTDKV